MRLPAFGFTAIVPLLGAASVKAALSPLQIWGLVGVALAFHQFGYVLNDLVDLPVDRRQPGRAAYPLVRGSIQPGQALVFALLQMPLAFALTLWLGGGAWAWLALALAFVGGAAYDLWGKRTHFPPLTDLVQGLAWAALACYGATMAGAAPARLSWLLASFILLYIVLVNGIHGNMRDLAGDLAAGARTTAILLGARLAADGRLVIPRQLVLYSFALQALLSGLLGAQLLTNDFGYALGLWLGVLLALLALQALCIALLLAMLRPGAAARMNVLVMAYIILSLIALIVLYAPALPLSLLLAVLITFFGPLLIYDSLPKILRWARQRR